MSKGRQEAEQEVFSYLRYREVFGKQILSQHIASDLATAHVPLTVKEGEIALGEVDKVFASKWLDETHVVIGTKCNQLIVLNLQTAQKWMLPMINGIDDNHREGQGCGIHTISVNDNLTYLATGGKNPNNVGIYRLPSLEPILVGQYHKDWLFSSSWITDTVLASGSRDGTIAMWCLTDKDNCRADSSFSYPVISPRAYTSKCPSVDRIRDMSYNTLTEQLITISSNGYFHLWDPNQLKQVMVTALPYCKENVCLGISDSEVICAIGSLSHVAILDTRGGRHVGTICSKDPGAGVRSVSFKDLLVTIGTGAGSILFYDLRNNKFLERADGTPCHLSAGKGWLRQDSVYREYFWNSASYPNAIYTHCYDKSGLKLFAAGGPLALGLYGNYSALWD